jgi:hypothetical protein
VDTVGLVEPNDLITEHINTAMARMKLQGQERITFGLSIGCVPIPLAIEILGVSRARIYVLQDRGRLEFFKSGGQDNYTYVTIESIREYIVNRDEWKAELERNAGKPRYIPTGRPRGRPRKLA